MKRAVATSLAAAGLAAASAVNATNLVQTLPASEYLYRAQARDTLIGLSRRLLKDPRQWRGLQKRNAIVNPTRIPVGTAILIPRDWLRQTSEAATVTTVVGAVTGDGSVLKAGDPLHEGEKIDTAAGAYVTFTLADGSLVTLSSSSILEIARLKRYEGTGGRDTEIKLDSGRLETQVKPQGEAGRFHIRTPVALSAVRGTEFRRAFEGPKALDKTEVIGGSVGVSAAATAATAATGVLVPAGFGTVSDASSGPRPPVKLLPPPDMSSMPARFEDKSVNFAFPAVDGATAYHAQVATDGAFQSIVAETTSAIPAFSFPGLPDSRYFLRVRSRDVEGLEGMDGVHEFERHRLPPPPQSTEPRADTYVTGDGASFGWTAVDGAAAYRFQLGADPKFAGVVAERDQLSATRLALGNVAPGTYYWRIASIDSSGTSGRWGDAQRYTQKRPPDPLPPPALHSKSFELSWAGDPGQHFQLQVARDLQFQRIEEEQSLDAPRAILKPLAAGVHYVRVRATDPDGYQGPYTPPRRFVAPLPWWAKLAPVLLAVPFL
jgi:hypothetical protein